MYELLVRGNESCCNAEITSHSSAESTSRIDLDHTTVDLFTQTTPAHLNYTLAMTSSIDPEVTAASNPAYVRPAKPSEIPALAAIYERAFSRDPAMNWFGCVRTLVPHHTAQDPQTRRTLTALRRFQLVITKMTQISGLITVVIERDGTKENVVGGALWSPPGVSADPSFLTLLRISPWRILWHWGLGGLKVCVCVSPRCQWRAWAPHADVEVFPNRGPWLTTRPESRRSLTRCLLLAT